MYESPVEVILKQMRMQHEDNIFKAIQEYDVHVNKEELIKALQYDRGQYDKGYSDGFKAALEFRQDVIESQKAEIERLQAEIEETNEADREAELQALKESKENAKLFCEAINHAKSEAVKEFAERLKEKADSGFWQEHCYVDVEDIDNLVKEMTEQSVNYGSSKTE